MNTLRLSIGDYQCEVAASIRPNRSASEPMFLMLGLSGEIGSLLSQIKKKQRDSLNFDRYRDEVNEEFGDCLWYFSAICTSLKVHLSQIVPRAIKCFSALQPQHLLPFAAPSTSFEKTLIALFAKAGELADSLMQENKEGNDAKLEELFGLFLKAADEAGVSLVEVAQSNLLKIKDRWPIERRWDVDFDSEYPAHEKLPNGLAVEMYERAAGNNTYVVQSSGGIFIGDRLTDNIMHGDDYRFHDVFHYAYASVLGWSPVTRALLKRKRKSETKIDEGQDSARAVIIEEGIATFIFGEAKKNQFFKDEKQGDMSFALLKQVRQFVQGFEPEKCPLWLWEDAILQGCEAFRFLRQHRKARLTIDRGARRLRVEELKRDPDSIFA